MMNNVASAGNRLWSRLSAVVWVAGLAVLPLSAVEPLAPETVTLCADMVAFSRAPGGMCTVIGPADTGIPAGLATLGRFVVHALVRSPDVADRINAAAADQGLLGQVSCAALASGQLPYAGNLISIAVVDDREVLRDGGTPVAELARVLSPLGTVWVRVADAAAAEVLEEQLRGLGMIDVGTVAGHPGWVRGRKAWPADIDEWTHYLHGADGNPVARDRVVGPPHHYQWVSDPMWLRSHETVSSISTLVTTRGRLYYIEDQAPISMAGQHNFPDSWFLVCRDAFNGVFLWKIPIRRWGWREWKNSWFSPRPGDVPLNLQKRLVAVGDYVYCTLGYQAPVSRIDATTGEVLQTYEGTDYTNEILFLNGTLVLSVVRDEGLRIMAVNADTGDILWHSQESFTGTLVDYYRWTAMHGRIEPVELDPASNIATDGDVVALIDGNEVVGVDYRTGATRWRTAFPSAPEDDGAGGIRSGGNLWVGTMIVKDGVVVHASPSKLAGLSAASGEILWEQPKRYIGHLWYAWKDVFVIDGLVWTWTADLQRGEIQHGRRVERPLYPPSVVGYDIRTGEVGKTVDLGTIFVANHHHRCYRNKATTRYILASRRGTEFVDLEQGRHTVHNWVRGTCHMGMMPANGLHYAPPHPCACYIAEKISGMNALAPARADEPGPDTDLSAADRLTRGPAAAPSEGVQTDTADWPTFRHDAMRSGSVETALGDGLAVLWERALGREATPATSVDDVVFVALTGEHTVLCLDARTGETLWRHVAGGAIDSPPTYYRGVVLFGSADGYVTCLRAADGAAVWRFMAAPGRRLMGAFDRIESAWPVHGSVLVHNDLAYVAAGRSSQLDGGIFVYALDPMSGEVKHQAHLEGPDYAVGDFEHNCGLPMGALADVMMVEGDRIHMRAETFDAQLNPVGGRPELDARFGLLEDSYFKRVPWRYGGEYGRLLVHDKRSVYYVRMFDSLEGLNPSVYFTPGEKGYLLFGKDMSEGKRTWMERVPIRIRAMVLASGQLIVAGPPDVVDPSDPLGAVEGRKGGVLYVVDGASGDRIVEQGLPSPPVFNGATMANGRLFITREDGGMTCLGTP